MTKKVIRSWLSLMLSVLLTLVSVAPAFAVETPLSQDPDIALLQSYGIVKGDGSGDLKLDTTITRAELATIAVRAMGSEELSTYFENSTLYSDMTGRFAWANRYAAMANSLGAMKGRGDGTFDPGSDITNGEVFTVLLRLVEREPQGEWNPQLIMSTASQLGITEGPTDVTANLPAYRGAIFKALAKAMTKLQLADGSTALRKYIDKTPPVLTVDAVPTTVNATAAVTGTANGATSVTVNGQAATLTGTRFTANVSLTGGANTVAVVATDAAGNTATQNITITRSSNAAKIEVTGNLAVKPGDSTTIKATAYDSANQALPAGAVTARLSNSLATYDATTGIFRAGSTPGTATITFTSGNVTKTVDVVVGAPSADVTDLRITTANSGAFTVGKNTTVLVEAIDADGAVVTKDHGRSITLVASGVSGVTVTPASATTVAGVATFTVVGSKAGESKLSAVSTGVSSATYDVVFGTGTRVVLTASRSAIPADGTSTADIRASLQDDNGNVVPNNTGSDIEIDLSMTSTKDASYLSGRYVIIRRGAASSTNADSATLVAGQEVESARVTGTISSTHKYTVVPVSVSVSKTTAGSGSRLGIVGGTGTYEPGRRVQVTVRVEDSAGNINVNGSYAFQIEATTSNGDPIVGGLPEGLTVELGQNTNYTPVKGAPNSVVARTENGSADLYVTYEKSGVVTLKVVTLAQTDDAYNHFGDRGTGSSSRGLTATDRTVRYSVDVSQADHLIIKMDVGTTKNQSVGLMRASTGTSGKLKVYLVDAGDGHISNYNGYVTVDHVSGVGTRVATTRVRASSGVAEFTITGTSTADEDTWSATTAIGSKTISTNDQFVVRTYSSSPSSKPDVPTVSPTQLTVDDEYLTVNVPAYSESPWGYVKVLRSSTVVYTTDVMYIGTGATVRVPRSVVTTGQYAIKINNGVGDSPASALTPQVKVDVPRTMSIASATYDGVTNVLKVAAPNMKAAADGGTIDPTKLSFKSGSTSVAPQPVNTGSCTITTGARAADSYFTCTLADGPNPRDFNARVKLEAQAGWYTNVTTGEYATKTTSTGYVSPLAYVSSATRQITLSGAAVTGGKLYLNGANLSAGSIDVSHIIVGGAPLTGATISVLTSKATIQLTQEQAQRVKDATSVTLEAGWLTTLSGSIQNQDFPNVPLTNQ